MTTTADIKPFVDRMERDLLDRPARLLIYAGAAIMPTCIVAYVSMHRWAGVNAERYDGVVAIAALLGGILIIAAIVVRILQRGRREEIRQELSRALAGIETERARRDIRLMDLVGPVFDVVQQNNLRIEEIREDLASVLKRAKAEAYVDTLNVAPVVKLPRRRHEGSPELDR